MAHGHRADLVVAVGGGVGSRDGVGLVSEGVVGAGGVGRGGGVVVEYRSSPEPPAAGALWAHWPLLSWNLPLQDSSAGRSRDARPGHWIEVVHRQGRTAKTC